MRKMRIALALTAALVTTVTLAACSSTSGAGSMNGMDMSTSTPSSVAPAANTGPHNDADVAFASGMVPHHQQAVEMADMILQKQGIDSGVVTLAKKIKAAQAPEITTMSSWLKTWGATPSGTMTGMPGMDMGTGLMSEADMAQLDKATGPAASKLFLQQMIQHHEGALTMAATEISGGKNLVALALAKSIVKGQTAEIAEMKSMLSSM